METITANWHKNMHRYLSTGITCSEKQTVFQERSSRNYCEPQGTDNVQGQMYWHIFEVRWREAFVFIIVQLFLHNTVLFGRPLLQVVNSKLFCW